MAEKPASERTEQPTPRKIEKARKKGQVPESEELASIATLLALMAVMVLAAPSMLQWAITEMTQGLSCASGAFTDNKSFLDFIEGQTIDLLLILCPILIAIFAGSVFSLANFSTTDSSPLCCVTSERMTFQQEAALSNGPINSSSSVG